MVSEWKIRDTMATSHVLSLSTQSGSHLCQLLFEGSLEVAKN